MKKTLLIAAALALMAIGLSARAGVVLSGTAYMTQGDVPRTMPDLQVMYSVSLSGSLYTYSYVFSVGNLSGSTFTPTTANPVTSFTVDTPFSTSIANISTDSSGIAGFLIANNSITWNYSTPPNSDTVSYTSLFGPALGGGSGNDGSPAVSWSTENPGGSRVPDPAPPATVPEASTIMAGALMLLPLGIGAVRSLRKGCAA
jgi:hypothetical protein